MLTPLLFLSDSPDSMTGLGRITRDLATVAATLPELNTASLGRGALCSARFPWQQYSYPANMQGQWGENYLQPAWQDFAGRSDSRSGGIIFTVWDASRLLWFARPDVGGLSHDLATFLGPHRRYQKWGYFPVDSTGPDPTQLSAESCAVLSGYDRVVVASEWAAQICRQSGIACDWLPHGLDMNRFHVVSEQERLYRRDVEGVADRICVGAVMANQARKDFPTLFHAASLLLAQYGPSFVLWLHTDIDVGYWNIHALAADYNIPSSSLKVTYTGQFNDARMSAMYTCCDATVLVSGGEGFGYPVAESMACGTPAITQSYAAGAELTLPEFQFDPLAFRVDTSHNCLRGVYDASHVALKVVEAVEKARVEGHAWRGELAEHVACLSWSKLKQVWRRWMLEGLKCNQ